MKKTFVFIIALQVFSLLTAATPDFSMIGFATLNGGTTGGEGGQVVRPTNFEELKAYAEDKTTPYIIEIDREINTGLTAYIEEGTGKITTESASAIKTTYGEIIRLGSNKTLIGIGNKAFLNRIGIVVQCQSNIIIRNIKFTMQDVPISKAGENKIVGFRNGAEVLIGDPDCICIQADDDNIAKDKRESFNIWIDHCEFYNYPKSTEHKDRYDGLLDIKNNVQFVTVSWCHFHDHSKACLFGKGNSDNFDRTTTLHHNYFQNIQGSRLPLLRHGRHHYYNNYQENCLDGLDPRINSNSYIENCYFKDTKQPICDADGGLVTQINNIFENCKRIPTGEENIDESKVDKYNTFTATTFIPSKSYNYNTDKTTDVPDIVKAHAGVGKLPNGTTNTQNPNTGNIQLNIYTKDKNIHIETDNGNLIRIFSGDGKIQFSAYSQGYSTIFSPAEKGFYVIQITDKAGNKTSKKTLL
ncbi:hypothetical protein D0T49_12625 [Paludibacter sp. 221]|uniref:pectate lyase family protein n=1 Tax=Paludibacter sp. 221 TaxID=2302939 RepID=UPI0013D41B02|nr:hypothetical protein [Paludibacter sp. 221]NDV47892.1 hypothetical protein [Paludibacter sp. 221]